MLKKFGLFFGLFAVVSLTAVAGPHDRSVRFGAVKITGSGMMLVGTVSTTSADRPNSALNYMGWTLIVIGALIDGGDVAVGAEIPRHSNDQVFAEMVLDAKATVRSPGATSGQAISYAAVEFETDAKNYNTRARQFAQMVLDVDAAAQALSGKQVTEAELSAEVTQVLGDNNTKKNQKIVTNLFALAGVVAQ